jgi:acyl-CoA thioester hydrolase
MAATPHRFHYHVTYRDCTVGNHIYYGNYPAILEAARGEFFRSLGGGTFLELSEAGVIFPVVECALRYRTPARYDDVLTVETTVTLAKGARLNLAYRLLNQRGELVLEAETFHACTSLADKPQRLPARLVELLAPFNAAATG